TRPAPTEATGGRHAPRRSALPRAVHGSGEPFPRRLRHALRERAPASPVPAPRGGRRLEPTLLIERCQAGDPLAWEALVARYQDRVFGITLHFLRNREEARDTAQDVFVNVYRGLATLEPGRPFLPWLLRLAR